MPGDIPSGSYKAAVIEKAKGSFKIVEKPFRPVGPTEALVKVLACGVCHSDSFTVNGVYQIDFPRAPGHEVCGEVVALGELVPQVRGLKVGVKVGRGWHGGHCFGCDACMEGDFVLCKSDRVSGIHDDGGYAEYMYAPWESLAVVPLLMDPVSVAPLMCAGVTVFNGLRECKIPPPALVAVLGVGGLGHLAIQFAAKCGYTVVAIARGADKEQTAKELGATHYIDSKKGDAGKQLKALGNVRACIATATDSKSQSSLLEGMGRNSTMIILGIDPKPIEVSSVAIIGTKCSVAGHASGTAYDSQETLEFAKSQNVKVVTQEFPLEQAQQAYDGMMDGKAHFRNVIVPGKK